MADRDPQIFNPDIDRQDQAERRDHGNGQHHEPGVAGTAQGAAEDHVQGVKKQIGGNDPQQREAEVLHRLPGCGALRGGEERGEHQFRGEEEEQIDRQDLEQEELTAAPDIGRGENRVAAAQGLADQHAHALGDAHRRHEGQGVDRQDDIGCGQFGQADPPDQQNKQGEGQDIHGKLERSGNPEAHQPGENLPIRTEAGEDPEAAVVLSREDQAGKTEDIDPPGGHRGDGGAFDAQLRHAPVTEDQGIVEGDIDENAEEGDDHHRSGDSSTGEKGGEGNHCHMENGPLAEYRKIVLFEQPHPGGMAGEGKKRPRPINPEQPEDETAAEGEMDALPEDAANPALLAPAGILGDEDPDIAADPAEKGDGQVGADAGRQCRRDRVDTVMGEEDPVGEFHQGRCRQAEDQGQADPQDLLVTVAPDQIFQEKRHGLAGRFDKKGWLNPSPIGTGSVGEGRISRR